MAASEAVGARWAAENPLNSRWHHTMLRITQPERSINFYTNVMGMTLTTRMDFPQWKFSLYFLATLPEGTDTTPFQDPTSTAAKQWLWSTDLTVLELTHNHGDEKKADVKMNNGNVEPHRGFGHIAFNTRDVYAACEQLEKQGIGFQKKPNDGRMKGLAFALDPDGYWVEIVKRDTDENCGFNHLFNLSQTMIRVKDPQQSIAFFRDLCGLTLVRERHFPNANFSLYFMANLTEEERKGLPDSNSAEASDYVKKMFKPVLELTHNHGTESKEGSVYHSGNEDPRGFGHVAFLVDDVKAAVERMEKAGVGVKMRPAEGKPYAFVYSPTGYWVELCPRGWFSENFNS